MRRSHLLLTGGALLVLALAACWHGEPQDDLARIARDYPAVDGSTSTHPLGVLLACKLLDVDYEWRMPPASERTVFPSHQDRPRLARRIEKQVFHHGTHTAYMNLLQAEVDLILVARAPSPAELAAAAAEGVELDFRPVARDALVFVVNVANPVTGLSLDEIRAIFSPPGIDSWSAVGGQDTAITPFQRQANSGSQELMVDLVMHDTPMLSAEAAPLIFTMGGVVSTMTVQKLGISFSVYYYIRNMAPSPATKMLAIEGIDPCPETIGSLQYPLTSEVFVVIRRGLSEGSTAILLRDWLLSDAGQAAILESGYVPIGQVPDIG